MDLKNELDLDFYISMNEDIAQKFEFNYEKIKLHFGNNYNHNYMINNYNLSYHLYLLLNYVCNLDHNQMN